VVAVVAAGAAVRGQQAADDAVRAIERQTLLADAERLASVSEEAPGMRQAIAFAIAAVRLARSPETERRLERALLRDYAAAQRVMRIDTQARTGLLSGAWDGVFVDGASYASIEPIESGAWSPFAWAFPETWTGRPMALAGSPSQELVAAIGGGPRDGWLGVADLGGREIFHFSGDRLGGEPAGLGFSRDGRRLVVLLVTGSAGAVEWRTSEIDPVNGARRDDVHAGTLPGAGRWRADVSPDASTAVLWTTSPGIAPVLVDLADGEQVALSDAGAREGASVSGYRATSQGAIELWDDGHLVLFGRDGSVAQHITHSFAEPVAVSDAAVSPDLTWAVTVGEHGTVDLWDLDAQGYWKSKDGLAGHTGDVTDAAIGPDGQLLTVAPNEGESILWQVRGAAPAGPSTERDLIRRACAVIGDGNINTLDWARYLPGRPWRPTCSDLG
jgi:hypothetical protein